VSATDIFLSYARQDRPTARTFAECLAEEGFSVWWDASLHSGETFDEVIEQRLRDARAVVVLWSPRSVASRWVRAEATLADRRNKLVPAIIEACDRPIVFELTHTAELADWRGDRLDVRWRGFVEDLQRLIEAKRQQEAAAAPHPHPEPAPEVPDIASRPHSSTRHALKPGNDEVIVAAHPQPPRPAPLQQLHVEPAPVDLEAEVHCLEVQSSELPDGVLVVDSSSMKVGRSAPADIVLPHKSISREHCVIGMANDELLVTDLNSTNGTYIDDERVTRATILPIGSVLRLGQVALRHAIYTRGEAEKRAGLADFAGGRQRAGRVAASS
jgi:hypothetical protein